MAAERENMEKLYEGWKDYSDQLFAQLECPVCMLTCSPPIFMCKNGHKLCSNCKPKLLECPTCREPGSPDIRYTLAERVSDSLSTVDCKYKEYGCKVVVLKQNLKEHILNCNYRYDCMLCKNKRFDVLGMTKHLTSTHPTVYSEGDKWRGEVLLTDDTWMHIFLSCHDQLFRIVLFSYNNGMLLSARFLKPIENIPKFKCCVKFISDDGKYKGSYLVKFKDYDSKYPPSDRVFVKPDNLNCVKTENGSLHCKITIKDKTNK